MKSDLTCPACNSQAILVSRTYFSFYQCTNCEWQSSNDTLDIAYKDPYTSPLSNLFPHSFVIDGVNCKSMESFIQSLKVSDIETQKQICSNYSGVAAAKLKTFLPHPGTGFVYWQGEKIERLSSKYTDLITRAYDELFSQNLVFQKILLDTDNMYLIHSIGKDRKEETLLTEKEFRFQLNRLRDKNAHLKNKMTSC